MGQGGGREESLPTTASMTESKAGERHQKREAVREWSKGLPGRLCSRDPALGS